MNILVTGAAGFIGRHVTRALVARGHHVLPLDRRRDEDWVDWGLWNCDLCCSPSERFGGPRVEDFVGTVEVVVHLAAKAGTAQSWDGFPAYLADNVLATRNLLVAMVNKRVKRLVHVSSSSVYGAESGPEDAPLRPVSPYGVTKAAGEMLVNAYTRQYGLETTILRPFTAYGPGQRPDMVHRIFIDALLKNEPVRIEGDGNQSRSHTYVGDVAEAICLCLEMPGSIGKMMNIGSSDRASILDLLRLMEDILGGTAVKEFAPRRVGDQDRTEADCSLAREVLGWEPRVRLREGLELQAEWQWEAIQKEKVAACAG